MIIEIQQVDLGENSYKCYIKGENICDVYKPYQLKGVCEHFFEFFQTGKQMRLYFCKYEKTYGKTLKDRFTTRIFDGEELVGSMVGDEDEYDVFNIEYYGAKYILYLVYMGRGEPDYICIYDEAKQLVGEIRRTWMPKDEYDYYVAFTRDDSLMELMCLAAVFIDNMEFNHAGNLHEMEYTSHGCRQGYKYHNADFVNYIAAEEGFDLSKRMLASLEEIMELPVYKSTEAQAKSKEYEEKSGIEFFKFCLWISLIGLLIVFWPLIKVLLGFY